MLSSLGHIPTVHNIHVDNFTGVFLLQLNAFNGTDVTGRDRKVALRRRFES